MPFVPQKCLTLQLTTMFWDKNFVKYLGILIDADLSCKYHTDYICHKISKSIGIVAKLGHYIPRPLLLNIYHTLIAPYMNYSICTWRSCAQVYQKRLLVLQKRAFHLIFFGLLENTQFSFLSMQDVFWHIKVLCWNKARYLRVHVPRQVAD